MIKKFNFNIQYIQKIVIKTILNKQNTKQNQNNINNYTEIFI